MKRNYYLILVFFIILSICYLFFRETIINNEDLTFFCESTLVHDVLLLPPLTNICIFIPQMILKTHIQDAVIHFGYIIRCIFLFIVCILMVKLFIKSCPETNNKNSAFITFLSFIIIVFFIGYSIDVNNFIFFRSYVWFFEYILPLIYCLILFLIESEDYVNREEITKERIITKSTLYLLFGFTHEYFILFASFVLFILLIKDIINKEFKRNKRIIPFSALIIGTIFSYIVKYNLWHNIMIPELQNGLKNICSSSFYTGMINEYFQQFILKDIIPISICILLFILICILYKEDKQKRNKILFVSSAFFVSVFLTNLCILPADPPSYYFLENNSFLRHCGIAFLINMYLTFIIFFMSGYVFIKLKNTNKKIYIAALTLLLILIIPAVKCIILIYEENRDIRQFFYTTEQLLNTYWKQNRIAYIAKEMKTLGGISLTKKDPLGVKTNYGDKVYKKSDYIVYFKFVYPDVKVRGYKVLPRFKDVINQAKKDDIDFVRETSDTLYFSTLY